MSVIRQDTDYAFRAVVNLAGCYGLKPVSARVIAQEEAISYQYACKIMQRLSEAGLVKSVMGPKGGYELAKSPSDIRISDVIAAIQGPVVLNKCLLGDCGCPRQDSCPIAKPLAGLQSQMDALLNGVTLADITAARNQQERKDESNGR